MYRRIQCMLNISMAGWGTVFLGLTLAGLVDWLGSFGWGLADDVWHFAGFVLFAPAFWVFGTIIIKINLAYARHTYGHEPKDRPDVV